MSHLVRYRYKEVGGEFEIIEESYMILEDFVNTHQDGEIPHSPSRVLFRMKDGSYIIDLDRTSSGNMGSSEFIKFYMRVLEQRIRDSKIGDILR